MKLILNSGKEVELVRQPNIEDDVFLGQLDGTEYYIEVIFNGNLPAKGDANLVARVVDAITDQMA